MDHHRVTRRRITPGPTPHIPYTPLRPIRPARRDLASPSMPLFPRRSKPAPPPPAPITIPTPAPAAAIPPKGADAALEPRIQQIGRELLDRARGHRTGLLSAKFYSDKLMDWSMRDHEFKVQMFRFVDAFPMLKTSDAVHEHLTDYLSQPGVKLPPGMDFGLKVGGLAKGLAASTISKQIRGMAEKFIAGTDAASALPGLRELWKQGIAFSVDLLGEACVSDEEADEYQRKYLDLIQNLPSQVATWPANPRLESDHLGAIPRTNVSIKISSLSAKADPIDTEGAIRDLMTRLLPILEVAREKGVFINFDIEQFALKDLTIELFQRCCEKVDFHAGLAMQAYLKSGPDDARRLAEWARARRRIVTVRLVKGAYWDYETIRGEQMGWPSPVWQSKWQTDACFERMSQILLDACPRETSQGGIKLALGSHNARSIAAALAGLDARGLPRSAIELQMLHGMADQLKHAATEMGLRVREYVPVGEMIPGMAYLVRRLLENTSNESWLKAGFLDNADPAVLLAPPDQSTAALQQGGGGGKPDLHEIAPERHQLSPASHGIGDGRPFFNESFRDFSQKNQRDSFASAIARATVPKVANDRTPAQAAEMVGKALAAFPAWRDFDARKRADALIRAAAAMRAQRDALSGVMIKEAGKTWREADADVCEAIDFCEYYARFAVGLFERKRLGRFIGELDELWYQPRGVAVIISPWNFPLAIMVGMTAAALVTGNTAIVKPAEQTPGIARIFYDILSEALGGAGVPPALARDVLHFCPAPGETTGAALVRDPRIALIAFTGSKAVGLDIIEAAARNPSHVHPGSSTTTGASQSTQHSAPSTQHPPSSPQEHVKRVICEMGGKNALIIDTSADLDEAVIGARHSAFGFQGQKCSACSRIIVVDPEGPDGPAISTFTRRFVESTRALVIGDPLRPGTDVGPVIDEEAADRIRRYIELGRKESRLELAMEPPAGDPFIAAPPNRTRFVGPHIFSHVEPHHAIATDEIFGPVVAILHATTFQQALDLANASPYKLTGGVFSRKPANLELAKKQFRVGNLYLNRGITGALVARQPFGGFGMSGVGSKAGGADYLLQFVEPRASCENTLRRGFAPEL
jgi:RHH-type transcriptional regulator, proline utilization regulon repressor / proline dehydrogenase / delta 1-pyrroline-5-carboxylate dehydrogenase